MIDKHTLQKYFEALNITLGSRYRVREKIWAAFGLPGHCELLASLPLQMYIHGGAAWQCRDSYIQL